MPQTQKGEGAATISGMSSGVPSEDSLRLVLSGRRPPELVDQEHTQGVSPVPDSPTNLGIKVARQIC